MNLAGRDLTGQKEMVCEKSSDYYLGLFEEAQEAQLLWAEDEEGVASSVDASGRSAHSVDVLLWAEGDFPQVLVSNAYDERV